MCLYALRTGAALIMSHDSRFDAERSLALAERTRATVLGGVPDHGRPHAALARARRHRPRATCAPRSPPAPRCRRASPASGRSAPAPRSAASTARWTSASSPCRAPTTRPRSAGPPSAGRTTAPSCSSATPTATRSSRARRARSACAGRSCSRNIGTRTRRPYSDDGWAHFGDLGRLDEDGFLHVTGRVKDTIIRGGSNINPFEVEDVLRGSAAGPGRLRRRPPRRGPRRAGGRLRGRRAGQRADARRPHRPPRGGRASPATSGPRRCTCSTRCRTAPPARSTARTCASERRRDA